MRDPEWFCEGKMFIALDTWKLNHAQWDITRPIVYVVIRKSSGGMVLCLPIYHLPAMQENDPISLRDTHVRVYADDRRRHEATKRIGFWRQLLSPSTIGLSMTFAPEFSLLSDVWINCKRMEEIDPGEFKVAEFGNLSRSQFRKLMRHRGKLQSSEATNSKGSKRVGGPDRRTLARVPNRGCYVSRRNLSRGGLHVCLMRYG